MSGQSQSSVSGVNRGLAANEDDLRKADDAARELEEAGGIVDLSKDLEKLQGKWKLIYSSAFSSRTLGGSRPGPPTKRLLPITLGQVRPKTFALEILMLYFLWDVPVMVKTSLYNLCS